MKELHFPLPKRTRPEAQPLLPAAQAFAHIGTTRATAPGKRVDKDILGAHRATDNPAPAGYIPIVDQERAPLQW
jgi:hypothetical protein